MSNKVINKKNKKAAKRLEQNAQEEEPNLGIRLSDVGVVKRTPSEQELKIQEGRILYIVDKILTKVKAAMCLQMLLENGSKILREHLQRTECDLVGFVLTKYSISLLSKTVCKESVLSQDIFSTFEKINLTGSWNNASEVFNDPAMLKAFEIVWLNPELNQFLLSKFKYLNNESSTNFVNTVKRFAEVMALKLAESGIEKIERERSLRKAWKFNSNIHDEISKVKIKLKKQKISLGDALRTKTDSVIAYQKSIEALNMSFRNEVKIICMNSENAMLEESRVSERRQVDLAEESKNAQQQYDTLLNKNLRREKVLRAKRVKVETQLTSWLTKFDVDIGERQAEFDIVSEHFQVERDAYERLRDKFEDQEIEYNILMAEKQEQDFKIWAEVAMRFLKNRSARRIQRAWRAYKQRKIAKLLKRKAQAKARAERKAAEAAKRK